MSTRKIVELLSFTLLIASPVALGVVYAQTSAPRSVAQTTQFTTEKNFPLNKPQVINFEPNQGFNKLTERQKLDQLRDWLLITVLSGKGLNSEKINQSIYDLPTVRYDFMSPVANFEYGTTRSRYIGDGKVVALVLKGTKPEQRVDDLAHIADLHRKDQGEKPQIIEVFEYEITSDKQSAIITRSDNITAAKIFSSDYGYYETTIENQNDLQNFLSKVDDITFAQVTSPHSYSSSLTIGGRKIHNVKPEDINKNDIKLGEIATLWQSERKIDKKLALFQRELAENLKNLPDFEQEKEIEKAYAKGRREGLVNGSGFSLDWDYNYPGLQKALDEVTPLLQYFKVNSQPLISKQEIQKVKQELQQTKPGMPKEKIVGYLQLTEKIRKFFQTPEYSKIYREGDLAKKIKQEIEPEKQRLYQEETNETNQYKQQLRTQIDTDLTSAQKSGKTKEEIDLIYQKIIIEKNQQLQQIQKKIKSQKDKEWEDIFRAKFEQELSPLKNFLEADRTQGFQYARYDGDFLRGTEVGMTLFYTDLLMKLWDFNFENSTIETGIKDFQPETRIAISSIYKQEFEDLSYTRLWLGPNDKGFQVAHQGNNLIFARNATQVYAASSNPLKPGIEEPAGASVSAFLSWWNNHYEEVARFEPQYQRLNQIMKWSLVINWLNDSGQSNTLEFLEKVNVKPDNWFPDWVKKQGDRLKFRRWEKIKFLPKNYKGTKTEALSLVKSEEFARFGKKQQYFYGGVSLARRGMFRNRTPLSETIELNKPSFRSYINYDSVKVQPNNLEFKTLNGTTYRLKPISKNVSKTIVEVKSETKLRSPNTELTNQPFASSITKLPNGIKLENAINDNGFSNLNVTKTHNGFKVQFESREIDAGYQLASNLSTAKSNPLDILKGKENVAQIRYSPSQPNHYYVKFSDSSGWVKFSERSAGGTGKPPTPPTKGLMAVAEPEDGARIFHLESLKEEQVLQETKGFQEFSGRGANPQEHFNPHQEAQRLVEDPTRYILAEKIDLGLQTQKIDAALKSGNYTKASNLIDKAIKLHGQDPDLMMRQALVDIHQGKLNLQIITLEGAKPAVGNFFDEISKLNFHAIETDTEFIYVQDSPGLNNLDFKGGVAKSVGSGSGVRAYQLKPGKIGDVNIGRTGFGDVGASSNPSTQYKGNNIANSLRFRFNNNSQGFSPDGKCEKQDEKDQNKNTNCCPKQGENKNNECILEKPVYVVTKSDTI
ncbi:hypothetical protein G7B40_017145 [Aetokthonos hydrillicola Thurmond2011]|jgi:hypothetical protein|uniref:Uncharacterized protein n=1 Tax=Aetokthonos hydrillicola Thurmond2011 TaxID=2712845 RepID=A0AAP5I760_9CYAN|nr:hypothetical protein [Aetokthonos hydrillicola]MBO3463514.1 hypothetical protein [Aetokthonos hydrillicola CCALA 1050]MBW4588598.1 hypothetical protein [Aetokthonos hydrillicola CCALA 1050]MDR9896273.1 hypothetical protein [Aetokthonos hydrillicola Thurmond2011]